MPCPCPQKGIKMPFQNFTSKENLLRALPSGHKQIQISSLSNTVDLKGKYFQGTVFKRHRLNVVRIPSIKLLLQEESGGIICFHGFGNIATDLDTCSVGDTIVLLKFEVELAPQQSRFSSRFQVLVDDRNHVKPLVWVLKKVNSIQQSSSEPGTSKDKGDDQNQSYIYTPLNDLKVNSKVNIYGVITHMRNVIQTSSGDKFLLMNITDMSMPDKGSVLTCNLFNSDVEKLPTQAKVGDVIRFHRLKTQNYNGKIQARNGPGFHWLLFHGSLERTSSSSPNYTLEKQDREQVQKLLEWSQSCFSSDTNDETTILDAAELSSSSEDVITVSSSSSSRDSALGSSSSKILQSNSPRKNIGSESIKYQLLRDVKTGTLANVFGVVIYVRPPTTTKLSQFHLMINITDHSLRTKDDKLTCNLFHRDQDKLPCEAQLGDVIRLTQLKIQGFQGTKQGNGTVNWALFRDSCDLPLASSDAFTPSPGEKKTVMDLWKWWQKGPNSIPLSQCTPRQYFNLVCQVIGVYLEENNSCRVVRIWDGTSFQGKTLKRTNEQMQNEMEKDDDLEERASTLAADLFLFDNHAEDSSGIKPGDIIKVTNLHANVVAGLVEMTLHGGVLYNKGVTRLEPDNPEANALQAALKRFTTRTTPLSPSKKGRGKRHLEEASGSEASPLPRKYAKKRHNSSGGLDDTQSCNNNRVSELALAKEYENISQSAELSQCDRLAVEAYLKKTKTAQPEDLSAAQGTDKASRCQGSESSQGDVKQSLSKKDKREEHEMGESTSHKETDKESERESSSGSSSEASPSIWLSLYTACDDESASSSQRIGRKRKPMSQRCVTDISQEMKEGASVENSQQAGKVNIATSPSTGRSKIISAQTSQLGSPNSESTNRTRAKFAVENNDMDDASSQDTFVTASESMTPKKNTDLVHREQQIVSSPSEVSIKRLSLRQSESPASKEKQVHDVKPKESDNTISSSLDTKCKSNDVVEVDDESQISSSTDSKNSEPSRVSSQDPDEDVPLQCLLQTATVVLNHPNVKRSTLKDVQYHKVPHKFKILVRMLDYHPKPATAESMVSFCCPDCNYRLQASELSQSDSLEKERTCPNCSEDGPALKPMIILKFLLSDGKHDIICYLCKSNAVEFFQGMEPLELLSNKDCVKEVQHYLDRLCPSDKDLKDKPFMECCIFSYSVKGEILYQIFDTAVA